MKTSLMSIYNKVILSNKHGNINYISQEDIDIYGHLSDKTAPKIETSASVIVENTFFTFFLLLFLQKSYKKV